MFKSRVAKTDAWGTPFLKRRNLLCLLSPDAEAKAFVMDKLHDYANHVFVWQKSKKLTGKITARDSITYRSQVDKHDTSIFLP